MDAAVPDEPSSEDGSPSDPLPAWLDAPPQGQPPILVTTAPQVLPFEGLTPENFEKLVVRLIRLDADVEHCQQYGIRGQDQHGIDLYARLRVAAPSGRRYRSVQCRNVATMTDTDIAATVEEFLAGRWAARSDVFVIATRVSAVRTDRAEAVEAATEMLWPAGVRFEMWDGEELSHRLRELPGLVASFFGPEAARRFCSSVAADWSHAERNVTEEMLRNRLPQLPPSMESRLVSAFRDDAPLVWRLVTALTSIDAAPAAVVEQWQRHRPTWLDQAPWQIQVAAAELAAGYGSGRLAAELMVAAVAQGAARRDYRLARAAALYYELSDDAGWRAAVADLGPVHEVTDAYARAMIMWLGGDAARAGHELDGWVPSDRIDRNVRAALRLRLALTPTPDAVLTRESVDRALAVTRDALREQWSSGVALSRAHLLIARHGRGESPNGGADLREARELALRARDDRRTYRGDSAEATALACQAAVMAMDRTGAIQIGTVGPDGAIAVEADAPAVCEYVAVAAITLREFDLAEERMTRVTEPFARARLDALLAEARGGDPLPHILRALDAASDDQQLLQALHELARTGAQHLPRLDELRVRHPAEAGEIEAVAILGRGQFDEAIRRLRPRRRESPSAAMMLVEAYRNAEDVDACVQTLRDAADDFGDPDLRHHAAEILAGVGRRTEAEHELESLLASARPDWAGRADALRLAAQLAYDDNRPDVAVARLQTVLAIQPHDERSRWALVRVLAHRADLAAAYRALDDAPDPLEPTNVEEAELWIMLWRGHMPTERWVTGCVRLLRQFGASDEQFSASAISMLVGPGTAHEPLPDSLLGELHQEFEQFFQRWPESIYLRRLSTQDLSQLVAQMTEMVRTSQEERVRRRRLVRALLFSRIPLGLFAAAVRRTTAELAIRRGTSVLPARHPDPVEIAACADGARAATSRDVVIETTALATLAVLSTETRTAVLGAFGRVITTDDTMRDALIAEGALSPRSIDSWIYDEQSETGRPHQISQMEADRLADQAASLRALAESFTRYQRPAVHAAAELDTLNATVAASTLDLAHHRNVALWTDDPFLRVVARRIGVVAFSTPAALDMLVADGRLSAEQGENTIRHLINERIGDMPFDEKRLLELAEDDQWRAGPVAAVFGRPASWIDTSRALRLFGRIIGLAQAHRADAVPDWMYHAIQGAATNATSPDDRSTISAHLLTITLLECRLQGHAAASLVAAARQALADTDDPDAPSTPDPLETCAVLLRQVIAHDLAYDLATRYVIAVFAALNQPDQYTVIRALLK